MRWIPATGVLASSLLLATSLEAQAVRPDDLSRYTRPGQCKQLAVRESNLFWRDRRPDTVAYGPEKDSVPAFALKLARECAARFSVSTVSDDNLFGLVELYMWTGQRDLQQAALDRLLAVEAKRPVEHRAWVLSQLVVRALTAKPAQLDLASKIADQLDALDKSTGVYKMVARKQLSAYTRANNDLLLAEGSARKALVAAASMPQDDRLDFAGAIGATYRALAEAVALEKGGKAAIAILDTASTDATTLRPTGTPDLMMLQAEINAGRPTYQAMGTAPGALVSDHWYNVAGGDSTKFPRTGRASLLVFTNPGCTVRCYPMYGVLRRLHDKYSAAGLDIIVVSGTSGSFRNKLTPDPAIEAAMTRDYFLDFLKLPATLTVDETSFSRKQDGRRVNAAGANARNYGRGRSTVLIGKDGKVIFGFEMIMQPARDEERPLDALIARALR